MFLDEHGFKKRLRGGFNSGPRKLAISNTFAAATAHLLVSKQANLYLGDAES